MKKRSRLRRTNPEAKSIAEYPMDIDAIRAYCLSFPETSEKLQWGDALCFKVREKMFTVAALDVDSVPRLSFKCSPEVFAELIEREGLAPAPYVGRYQWVGAQALNTLGTRELKELIAASYELVLAKLPKKKAHKKAVLRAKPRQRS
jgi:predicted DNA-binding protein (MmcQ/YjbR family)